MGHTKLSVLSYQWSKSSMVPSMILFSSHPGLQDWYLYFLSVAFIHRHRFQLHHMAFGKTWSLLVNKFRLWATVNGVTNRHEQRHGLDIGFSKLDPFDATSPFQWKEVRDWWLTEPSCQHGTFRLVVCSVFCIKLGLNIWHCLSTN